MWRGLTGLSLVFAELVGATVILNKFTTGGRNLANAASILLLAIALQGIGRALRKVAELSWDEINRGLVGVGVTLAELVASLTILSNFTDIGSCLASAASLLMASWSLKNIGEALQTITEYSWDQISNAVSGIGGLFFVMAGTLAVLGQLGGFNTLLASAGLLVASYSLANIADAISTLTRYSWDQIQRAVDGIFDVFAALALTIGVLGKLAGFSSILGAAGLLVASKSLVEISQSISKLAEYSWDQIDNAVSGLITVFTILAGASGIVGALTGVLGLLGGGTILLASQSLGNIADAISTLTKYSWNQIQRSVDGLLLAMESIAGASTIATFGGAGAEAIVTCSKSLGDVARALGVMAGYSWEEIYKGVLGFKSALGVISNALNNSILSGPGADAFATIAQPMGDLAVSMGKWKGVVISQNLTERLPELGKGIASFWDAGFSADSLRSVAEPLGNLASSVNAWKNVTIPEDMQKNLKQLADGVSAFIFSESGANAISTIAFPLGNLANSLKNWKDVDVPDDLAGELREVASGVNAFTLTGTGSDNLAKCSDPLRNMGTALKTWQGITLGTYLGDMLESLAVGIMKFTGISEAITNIGSATTPLADLAVSMKAWSGTYVPANMTNMLTYLSDGIKSFTGTQSAISVFNTVSDALLKIATSMTSINNADFEKPVTELQTMITAINNLPSITSNLGTDLTTFSDTVGSAVDTFCFMVSSAASNVSTNLDNLNASITNTLTAFASNVSSGLGGVASTIATQTDAICTSLNSVGTSMANMVTGITDNMLSAQNAVTDSCSKIINSCTTTATQFEDVGRNFMVKMASGIRTENSPKTSASSILSGVKDTFTNAYSTFYNIGGNISKGLANGISDGRSKVVSAAVKVATDAIQAAKDASGVASPSKKTYAIARWCIIGAVNGINQNGSKLVDSFTDAMTDAMNATADVANNYRDYMNPTITPVVDLSSANKTVSNLNSLLPDNRMLDFTANAKARSVTATFKGRTEIEADYQKAILDSNAKVVTAVASLGTDISSYTDAIANSETAMYVDGKKLASSIVKPMNQQLGILAKRNG